MEVIQNEFSLFYFPYFIITEKKCAYNIEMRVIVGWGTQACSLSFTLRFFFCEVENFIEKNAKHMKIILLLCCFVFRMAWIRNYVQFYRLTVFFKHSLVWSENNERPFCFCFKQVDSKSHSLIQNAQAHT